MKPAKKARQQKSIIIVSGGQTGVDRAALDVALELGLTCGGWCPRGRLAEDGPLPKKYPLKETPSAVYSQRTEWNVRDSDGTLIITAKSLRGGTAYARDQARNLNKPVRIVKLTVPEPPETVVEWIVRNEINKLNVAGPRESQSAGIHLQAREYLRMIFEILAF